MKRYSACFFAILPLVFGQQSSNAQTYTTYSQGANFSASSYVPPVVTQTYSYKEYGTGSTVGSGSQSTYKYGGTSSGPSVYGHSRSYTKHFSRLDREEAAETRAAAALKIENELRHEEARRVVSTFNECTSLFEAGNYADLKEKIEQFDERAESYRSSNFTGDSYTEFPPDSVMKYYLIVMNLKLGRLPETAEALSSFASEDILTSVFPMANIRYYSERKNLNLNSFMKTKECLATVQMLGQINAGIKGQEILNRIPRDIVDSILLDNDLATDYALALASVRDYRKAADVFNSVIKGENRILFTYTIAGEICNLLQQNPVVSQFDC